MRKDELAMGEHKGAEGQKTKNTFLCWVINKTQMTPVFLLTSQNKLHQIFKQNLA